MSINHYLKLSYVQIHGEKGELFPSLPPGWSVSKTSQLISDVAYRGNIVHGHNLDDQACPTREVLGALTLPSFGVILLPGEACVDPGFVYCVDYVLP